MIGTGERFTDKMALPTFIAGTRIKAAEMNQAFRDMLDLIYPVGSYYETSDTSFDPNVSWGGTWAEDTSGRVLVAKNNGTFSTVGGTGGEETHTLTQSEMPAHSHNVYVSGDGGGGWTGVAGSPSNQWAGYNPYIDSAGGGSAHNNLQPYIVVKRWHRTA